MIECTLKQVRLLLELARAVALQPDISISDPGTSARSVHFTLLLMNADSICFYPRPFFGVYLCCRICEGAEVLQALPCMSRDTICHFDTAIQH